MVTLPAKYLSKAGSTLYYNLGYFWNIIYNDTTLLELLQEARLLNAAQASIDLLQVNNALHKDTIPDFNRERWYPLVLDRASKNTGPLLRLVRDIDYRIGPLTNIIPPVTTGLNIGIMPLQQGCVSYRITNPPNEITGSVLKSPFNTDVMLKGIDYIITDDFITMLKKHDPFDNNDSATAVLWAQDALYDSGFTEDYISAPLVIYDNDPVRLKTIGTKLWDILIDGPTEANIHAILTSLFNIDPTRVNLYSYAKLKATSDVANILPKVKLFDGIIGNTKRIITADWQYSDIIFYGNDANGNPRLRFDLIGTTADIDAYWSYVWRNAEINNVSTATLLSGYLNDNRVPIYGAVWGSLRPAELALNIINNNTIFAVIDIADNEFNFAKVVPYMTYLKELLPKAKQLFIIVLLSPDTEYYDLNEVNDGVTYTYSCCYRPGTGPATTGLRAVVDYPVIMPVVMCR